MMLICVDAIRFQKPTWKMNSNQLIHSAGSSRDTGECGTAISAVDCAPSSASKESERLMSHATLGVNNPVDISKPNGKTKTPVVLMMPDSKSGIRIFRTRSDSAIGQASSVNLKLLKNHMEEIAEEEDCDVKHVSKRGRYEAKFDTNCPDNGGEKKPGQQVAYLKLAVPLVFHQNSLMQTSPALTNGRSVENSIEPTNPGSAMAKQSGDNFNESFSSASEALLGCRTSPALGLAATSTENNSLSDSTNVLLRSRQFLPAVGKENAIHPNKSECNVEYADHGIDMQKKLSGLLKTSNITLRRISSFESASAAPKFYFGLPLSSSNIANMTVPSGLHSTSDIAAPTQPISSHHPLVADVTALHDVDVKPPLRPNSFVKMSPPAPRVIFLRKLPSTGEVESSNQFFGFPSFATCSPQRFSPPVRSENFLSSGISSSSKGHSFQTAMDS